MTEEERDRIINEIHETTGYKGRVHLIPVPAEVLETYTDNRPIKKVQLFRNLALFTKEEKEMSDKYSDALIKGGEGWVLCLISGAAYHVEDGWIIATLSESVIIVELFDGDCYVFKITQDLENPNKHNLVTIADAGEVKGCEWATVEIGYRDGSFDKASEVYNELLGDLRNIRKEVKDDDKPRYLPS